MLVFPGKFKAPDPQVPLALLYIAASLREEGFLVRILDMRLQDYRRFRVGNPVFVGISCMTGLQIKYALEFARFFRTQNTTAPLVWGGVHPTLLPEQTASNDFVDIVVRGEGELIIKDLAKALTENQPLDQVAGISYDVNGTIKTNQDGKAIDLDAIPIALPYDLLELEKYPSFKSGRFHIQTSRGCPHRCGFCYNSLFNRCRWRGKSAKRVLDEIAYILDRYPNIHIIDPIDDNVFVDEYRVKQICQGIIDRKLDFKWRANCRFDYLASYDKDFLELLEHAGCVELDFGGESGSERLQQMICKDVTAQEMLESVDKLHRWAPSIEPYVSWMSGLPGETDEDLEQTFDLMDQMREVNPKTQHYGIFLYTPFPSPVMNYLPPEFMPPQTLEEWGKVEVFHFNPPWHTKKQVEKLHAISAVTRCAFYPESRIKERGVAFRLAYNFLNKIAKYRWQHRNFNFPIELKIADWVARKAKGFL
ncbi:MAG: B12-binding domain-containing radical SAM protein [Candidatus Bathyarchaeota archaeon]|nr:B12-binding domain-containing radical SAM protein [Candidatus Bathyarchaeota archaeon]